jgi:hypothetical protein
MSKLTLTDEIVPLQTGSQSNLTLTDEVVPVVQPGLVGKPFSVAQDVLGPLNAGLPMIVAGPVDFTNNLLKNVGLGSENPVLGRQMVESFYDSLGIAHNSKPTSKTGFVMREVGENLSMLTGIGALSTMKRTWGYAEPIISYVRKAPMMSVLGDALISVPAGLGAFFGRESAERTGGDPEAGEALGRLGGAMAPLGVLGAFKMGQIAIRNLDESLSISSSASMKNAAKTFQGVVTPEGASRIRGGDDLPVFGGPTTAEFADDSNLLAFQRGFQRQEGQVGKARDFRAAGDASLKEGLVEAGKPSSDVAKSRAVGLFRDSVNQRINVINKRMDRAISTVQNKLRVLGPEASQDTIETLAREEMTSVKRFAETQEELVWGQIGDAKFDTSVITTRAQSVIDSVGKANRDKIPKIVQDVAKGLLDPVESFSEVKALRQRVTSDISQAYRAGDDVTQRLLGHLKEALSYDNLTIVAGKGDVREKYQHAIDYTRELKRVFGNKTPLGRALSRDVSEGLQYAPEFTLQRMLDGKYGKAGYQQIKSAVRREFYPVGVEGDTAFREAQLNIDETVKEFYKARFATEVAPNGTVNPAAVDSFISKNPVLDNFPELKAQMMDVGQAQQISDKVGMAGKALIKRVENQSAAARYTNGEIPAQMESIFKSKTPLRDTRKLIALARNDPTGQAMEGLQGGFYDAMIARVMPDNKQAIPHSAQVADAVTGNFNAKEMRRLLKEYTPVIRELYGDEGLRLLREVERGGTLMANIVKGVAVGGGSDTRQMLEAAKKLEVVGGSMGILIGSKFSMGSHGLLWAGLTRRMGQGFVRKFGQSGEQDILALLEKALYNRDFAKKLLEYDVASKKSFELDFVRFPFLQEFMKETPDMIPEAVEGAAGSVVSPAY